MAGFCPVDVAGVSVVQLPGNVGVTAVENLHAVIVELVAWISLVGPEHILERSQPKSRGKKRSEPYSPIVL